MMTVDVLLTSGAAHWLSTTSHASISQEETKLLYLRAFTSERLRHAMLTAVLPLVSCIFLFAVALISDLQFISEH